MKVTKKKKNWINDEAKAKEKRMLGKMEEEKNSKISEEKERRKKGRKMKRKHLGNIISFIWCKTSTLHEYIQEYIK